MRRLMTAAALAALLAAQASAQTAPVQITFGDSRDLDPVVSPDGNYLAFSSNRTGNFDIYLLNFGKSGITQMTQDGKDDRYPSWSRDNARIIFCSKRTGNGDLYTLSRAGSAGNAMLSATELIEEYPGFAPKGQGFLFAQGRERKLRIRTEMHVKLSSGTGMVNDARDLAEGDEPVLSPGGGRIAFVSRRTKNNDIWTMGLDGGDQTQLTFDKKDDENPRYSPDGKRIVFASNRTGNFDIWIMNTDGSGQRQLTADGADETQPCWSSGGYIYYVFKRGPGKSNIFRIKAPQ